MRKIMWMMARGVVGAAMLPVVANASIIESPVDVTGISGYVDLAYGDHTVNSGLDSSVDVDSYRFHGSAGDSVRLIVSGSTEAFDPQLVLRDSTGTVLQTVWCDGSSGRWARTCSASLDQELASDGIYYLNLSDVGSNEAGNYTLSLYQYPPTGNWNGIGYDTPLTEELGHKGDMDFLAFNGTAGTGVKLSLFSNTNGLDPRLEVWSPSDVLINDTWCDGSSDRWALRCSLSPELDLSETGIYKIGLSDVSWDELGAYTLGLSCIYGDCPTTIPSPIPVPAAVWLFCSGLAGLWISARPYGATGSRACAT